jgi:hypothetical protein
MNETPYTPTAPTPPEKTPSEDLVKRLCLAATGSSGWMKFLGVLSIIQGIVLIFTIWGILICWLPIWIGVILFKASGDAEVASRGAPTKLMDFMQKINRYFLIQGIISLIMVVVFLVMIFVVGMAAFLSVLG